MRNLELPETPVSSMPDCPMSALQIRFQQLSIANSTPKAERQRREALAETYDLLQQKVFKGFVANPPGTDPCDREEAVMQFMEKYLRISPEQLVPAFFSFWDPLKGSSWQTFTRYQLNYKAIEIYRQRTGDCRNPKQEADLSPEKQAALAAKRQVFKVPLSLDVPVMVDGSPMPWELSGADRRDLLSQAIAEIDYDAMKKLRQDAYFCIHCDLDISALEPEQHHLGNAIQKLRDCCPRNYPQCNGQHIMRLLVANPKTTASDVARSVNVPAKNFTTINPYLDKTRKLMASIIDELAQHYNLEIDIDAKNRRLHGKHQKK
jgi:hypothetical protein